MNEWPPWFFGRWKRCTWKQEKEIDELKVFIYQLSIIRVILRPSTSKFLSTSYPLFIKFWIHPTFFLTAISAWWLINRFNNRFNRSSCNNDFSHRTFDSNHSCGSQYCCICPCCTFPGLNIMFFCGNAW